MNNKEYLKKQISQKELQIKRLQEQNSSLDICNQLYNTLILEKAVLKKELEKENSNSILSTIKNKIGKTLRTKLPSDKKLICDYFND